MRIARALLALAACYSPRFPIGVVCDPRHPSCPSEQACVPAGGQFACGERGAIDASLADGAADQDGDGIPDGIDNCPAIANPSQDNFDGDRFGDACDPCPPYANDAPVDSDGDGVSDDCDPDPASPGDRIIVFDSLRHGLTAWNVVGAWTQDPDGAGIDLNAAAHASLTRSVPAATRTAVISAFLPATLRTGVPYPGAGTVVQYARASDAGIACELLAPPFNPARLALVATGSESTLAYDTTSFATAVEATTQIVASGSTYACRASAAGVSATSTFAATAPEVGVRVVGAQLTVHWILVISNAPRAPASRS